LCTIVAGTGRGVRRVAAIDRGGRMRYLTMCALVLAGLIHLLPLAGVLGAGRVETLYGVSIEGADMAILMRHRAALLGTLGGFMVVAAFIRAWRLPALLVGLVSASSFLWLATATGGYGAPLARVVAADWIALGALVVGLAAWMFTDKRTAA
jgi:hypothetical protein